jgi:hypothetical protein
MAMVFITFIELSLEGGWNEISAGDLRGQLQNVVFGRVFEANGPSEVRVVEPEVMLRSFMFGTGARVFVSNSVVSFDSARVQDELTIDDKNRTPDRKRLRLD